MKTGIIGTGITASYIVTAFCDWECEHQFILSPRNRERSTARFLLSVNASAPLILYPSCPEIESLLNPLGNLIIVNSADEMNALRSMTALMSPFYELVYSVVEWGKANHLSEPAAKAYATSFFRALTILAGETEEGKLKELAEEMTPGGLNWQATNYLMEHDTFRQWQVALDAIMNRVTGN